MTIWQWYAGRDEETFTVGPCSTRDDIIAEAQCDFCGEGFHIVEATKGTMQRWLPSGSEIVEQMFERSSDDGAFGEDYGEPTGAAEEQAAADADLDAVLLSWYGRHKDIFPVPWEFAASRNAEWIAGTEGPG
jgi:hypothetical protein